MPKRWLDGDEWYPVFTLDDKEGFEGDKCVEFTDEEIADYERVVAEFDKWQQIIGRRFKQLFTYAGKVELF